MKTFPKLSTAVLTLSILFSCSDDKEIKEEKTQLPPAIEKAETENDNLFSNAEFPKVYIEELDQSQEFFKEQHETSFSHVPKKNWMSFTAGKNGILTKILLFGKANYLISEHYGSGMKGFIRVSNPDKGPKLGAWSLSRDEIVNQLASQGLPETEGGWITIRIRGEVPQESGKTYYLVCDDISDGRPWFGAFAFSDGNSYLQGRHWLHPDHDLVFRTYVGKTGDKAQQQLQAPASASSLDKESSPTVFTSPVSQPPPPLPMLGNGPRIAPTVDYKPAVEVKQEDIPLTEPASQTTAPQSQIVKPTKIAEGEINEKISPTQFIIPASKEESKPKDDGQEEPTNKSLFDRLFKKGSE